MKRVIVSFLFCSSLLSLSCDTASDRECKRSAMNELLFISFHCSNINYPPPVGTGTGDGYTDYNDCVNQNLPTAELTLISCKGRDGVFP